MNLYIYVYRKKATVARTAAEAEAEAKAKAAVALLAVTILHYISVIIHQHYSFHIIYFIIFLLVFKNDRK
jgi:hypothetical protein